MAPAQAERESMMEPESRRNFQSPLTNSYTPRLSCEDTLAPDTAPHTSPCRHPGPGPSRGRQQQGAGKQFPLCRA